MVRPRANLIPFLARLVLYYLHRYQALVYVLGLVAIAASKRFLPEHSGLVFYASLGLMMAAFSTNAVLELMRRRESAPKHPPIPRRIRVSFLLGAAGVAVGVYALLAYSRALGLILLLGAYFYLSTAFKAYEDYRKSLTTSRSEGEE